MSYQIRYTYEAYDDLKRLYEFLLQQDIQSAEHALQVIEKAIEVLKSQGHQVCVVFTGKEHDDRNPDFFKEITQMVIALDIADCVQLLGFINREDQLCLMKKALAVIQPSLFEGWSTVIEDAKAIQAKVIASDINVHREQLEYYGQFTLIAVISSTANINFASSYSSVKANKVNWP